MTRKMLVAGCFFMTLFLSPVNGHGGDPAPLPFLSGEEIQYDIRKFGLKTGKAVLRFEGMTELDGEAVYLIVFTAQAANFYDEERIYVDPANFLPRQVERNLNIFGKKEQIEEVYDRQSGQIVLTKRAGGKETQQTLEKEGQIENIYGFIYRYRRDGEFNPGDSIDIMLPTKDVSFQMEGKQKLAVGKKVYEAYIMESDPKQYRVWFDKSPQKIPLRIDGAVGFGNTSMVLAQYEQSRPEQVEE
ncbi:MAG TPA: DUF3108 domain-containing protein [Candidatus Omnitrophota bacterium]|nr:DUF3108 domain-containing protein [Candidatus Omnitrophota bacterium]HPB69147.1 DUF3108 domain-containing protein [Candidatus Omnitrophota bacterium]HQO59216.1 DUF3108 domain-containing protein [Candidatus Omnitrophota bacterium]HQP11342.1 DUF3108 domain-containing protein [Candidatus Omnitrophota bacterium]